MRRELFIILLFVAVCAVPVKGVEPIPDTFLLNRSEPYSARAEVSVTLPVTQQDVIYHAVVYSQPNEKDDLCATRYLVEVSDSADNKSFYSYFDGNYFAYAGRRFREYHWVQDSLPFTGIQGRKTQGVHKSGLFALLVPEVLRERLNELVNNRDNHVKFFADSVVAGVKTSVLLIEERVKGISVREHKYVTEWATGIPIYYSIVTGAGTLSEQVMEVRFYKEEGAFHATEQNLIERYPEIFSAYRTSDFSASSLVGKRLPMFSLPSQSGKRYISDGKFAVPTMLVFLRSGEGVTAETVKAVKRASKEAPLVTDILWIFLDKNIGAVSDLMEDYADGYTTLFNAERFATQCGIANTPMIIIVDRQGVVRSIATGFSPNLKAELVQRIVNM